MTLRLERDAPELCRRRRVAIVRIAERLEIAVHTQADLDAPARWHQVRQMSSRAPRLWEERSTVADIVYVRAGLRDSARRFAIAHEIGHVLLHRRSRGRAISVAHQERFANTFAAELLIPRVRRAEVRELFRAANDPALLLSISDALGVSPRTLLRRAHVDDWLEGLDRIWLDIRVRPNHYTGRDRRARVFDAVLDRRNWFLPRNRSITGLLGRDDWLATTGRRMAMSGHIDISRWVHEDLPRSVHDDVPANVTALRLRRPASSPAMEVLACVELGTTTSRPSQSLAY